MDCMGQGRLEGIISRERSRAVWGGQACAWVLTWRKQVQEVLRLEDSDLKGQERVSQASMAMETLARQTSTGTT